MAATKEWRGNNEVRKRLAAIDALATKLSSADLEELEANLKKLEAEVQGLREALALPPGTPPAHRRFENASPSTEGDNLDRGPAVGSDPSAI